jgi:hypothetical protein
LTTTPPLAQIVFTVFSRTSGSFCQ